MHLRSFTILALAIVAAAARAQTAPPATAPQTALPTATMPESVYRALKTVVETHSYDRNIANRTMNLAALESLRQGSWPDYSRLRLVRVYGADNAPVGLAWCVSLTSAEMVYVSPERTLATLDRKQAGKIEDADYAAPLDALARYLKSNQKEDWHPTEFGFISDNGAHGLNSVNYLALPDQAIAAAWLGWPDRAAAILEGALSNRESAVVELIDARAWPSLSQGVKMLQKGADRTAILDVWQRTLAAHPSSGYEEQLKDMLAQLTLQVRQDAQRAKAPPVDPATLALDQQVQYYVDHLCDIATDQMFDPGECPVLNGGKATASSDALVKIGRPALPALVALLDDRRLTRFVGYFRTYDQHPKVLRYQDVAIKCIEAILDMHFYERSGTGYYLSTEKQDKHDKVVADVRSWWKDHGMDSAIKGQIARLDVGTINERIDTLRKIEKMDPTAVRPIEVLRRWSITARETDSQNRDWVLIGRDLPRIAEEMAAYANFEMLPEIRRLARKSDLGSLVYLVHWGDAEDFQFLRIRLRQAIAAEQAGLVTDENMVIYEVANAIKEDQSPLAVPLMVECLAYRQRHGLLGTPQGGVNFGIADECMENLIRHTNHNEGFVFTDPPELRNAALDRWIAWWKAQGQDAYLGSHPEVAKALAPISPSTSMPAP